MWGVPRIGSPGGDRIPRHPPAHQPKERTMSTTTDLWGGYTPRGEGDHSHSGLELAEHCLGAYHLRHGTDEEPEPYDPLPRDRGRVVHVALAEYNRELIDRGTGQSIPLADEVARRVFYDKGQVWLGSEHWPEVQAMVRTGAVAQDLDTSTVVGVERPFRCRVADTDWFLRGAMDVARVDGTHAYLDDYKTEHKVRSEADVKRDPQARRYAWAIRQEYPHVEDCLFRFLNVRHGVPRDVYFSPEEFEELVEQVEAELISAITRLEGRLAEDAEPEFTPGEYCTWCDWYGKCPKARAAEEAGTILVTEENAVQVAERVLLRDIAQRRDRKALGEFTVTRGMLNVGGKAFGHYPVTKLTWPVVEVTEALVEAGIDPSPALKLDTKSLDKLLLAQAHPDVMAKVKAMAVDKSYTRFDMRTHKEEAADASK